MKKFEIFVDGILSGMLDKNTAAEAVECFKACAANNYNGGSVVAVEHRDNGATWDFLADE